MFVRAHMLSKRRDDRGIFCGPEGIFVGPAPLLEINPAGVKPCFAPRSVADLNRDLEGCCGFPVDISSKMDGIGAIARKTTIRDTFGARIVLKRDPRSPRGFRTYTAL